MRQRGKLVTVFIKEGDRYHHKSLADAIVEMAHQQGLASATVVHGIEGFGRTRHLRSDRLLSLYDSLPLVAQVVDVPQKVDAFLPLLQEMVQGALVVTEDVEIEVWSGETSHLVDDV